MTTMANDRFTSEYIDTSARSAQSGGKVLEVGSAFGIVTLQALKVGATIVANDLDPRALAALVNQHNQNQIGNLVAVPGRFPGELHLPKNHFDAIYTRGDLKLGVTSSQNLHS